MLSVVNDLRCKVLSLFSSADDNRFRIAECAVSMQIRRVFRNGAKSNAEQESRVLMLSEKARGDANPILLIDEDDVTAGHAASVGRVDPVQPYYFESETVREYL